MKPTAEDILEEREEWEIVEEKVIDSWRHGSVNEIIVKHVVSGKFYGATYRDNPAGDYNELRDEKFVEFREVRPVEKIVVEYEYVPT